MLSTPTEGKRRVWCQLVSLSRDTSLKGGRDSGGEGDRRWGARDAFEADEAEREAVRSKTLEALEERRRDAVRAA